MFGLDKNTAGTGPEVAEEAGFGSSFVAGGELAVVWTGAAEGGGSAAKGKKGGYGPVLQADGEDVVMDKSQGVGKRMADEKGTLASQDALKGERATDIEGMKTL